MPVEGGLRTTGRTRQSSTEQPLVSVLTVVYNGKSSIERTINSVLEQDYPNIEYIIIDGNSNDGTLDIIQKYSSLLDYYISEPDSGIYDAMNKGIDMCTGDIIGIINSDDWYEPGTIPRIAEEYKKCSTCVQYGLLRLVDNKGPLEVRTFYASRLPQHMISHPTTFVPSSLYKKYGRFNLEYKIAADYDLMLRFYTNEVKFNFIHEVLANFTMGGACQSNDIQSTKEALKSRLSYGVISHQRYRKILLKTLVTSQIRRVRNILKSILSNS